MGVEGETAWIRSHLESPDSLVICCEMEGKIVASCDLRFNSKIKTSHRAALGITVRRAYWGLGIGSAMFEAMITAAKGLALRLWSWSSWKETTAPSTCMKNSAFGSHPIVPMLSV